MPQSRVHFGRGALPQQADRRKARLTLEHRDHARTMLRVAQDGVPFPVPEARAMLRPRWTRRDGALPGEPAATVVGPVPLAQGLGHDAQVRVERAAPRPIGVNAATDRLVADREEVEARTPADDLLGAPVLAEQVFHERPLLHGELRVAPRHAAALE